MGIFDKVKNFIDNSDEDTIDEDIENVYDDSADDTYSSDSAASDVYKRQRQHRVL